MLLVLLLDGQAFVNSYW